MVIFSVLLAFGFGVGLNPPIDIHIPPTEEIALEIEEQRKYAADETEMDL